MRKKLFIICFIVLYAMIASISIYPAYAEENDNTQNINTIDSETIPPKISAKDMVLIDSKTGQVLCALNPDHKAYPASITKILTAAIALEKGNLNDVITIDEEASSGIPTGSSAIVMDKGEKFTLEQLLYGLMLISGNDAAVAIAKYISGSTNNFVELMNKTAKEWGAKNTNFVNPHGFHNDNHFTTAYDMAMIAKHAMTIPKFREIVSTLSYTNIPKTVRGQQRHWENINSFIHPNSKYYYKGSTGIKTGYTSEAHHTLVASAQQNDMELIVVLMGEPSKPIAWKDAAALLDYGFNNFHRVLIKSKGTALGTVNINNDTATAIQALLNTDVEAVVPKTVQPSNIQASIHLPVSISGEIKKDEIIGNIDYYLNGSQKIASADLVASQTVNKKSEANTAPLTAKENTIISYSNIWQIILIIILLAALWTLHSLKKSHNNSY